MATSTIPVMIDKPLVDWDQGDVETFLNNNKGKYFFDDACVGLIVGQGYTGRGLLMLTRDELVGDGIGKGDACTIMSLITDLKLAMDVHEPPSHFPFLALPDHHHIVMFWKSLCQERFTVSPGWITFPKGIYWMGTETCGRSLYVRDIYNQFWGDVTGLAKTWTITGTPGVGKTFFSYFLFYKIRQDHPDAVIVRMSLGEKILIFYPTGIVEKVDNIPPSIETNSQNWIISDAVLPPFTGVACRVVVVTSPKLVHESMLAKSGFRYRYMPIWSMDEIETVRKELYPSLKPDHVEREFKIWGGVPRTILQYQGNDFSWNSRLLGSLNIDRVKKCMEFNASSHYREADDVCGKLIHLFPVDDTCKSARVDWASPAISNIAFNILVQDDRAKAKSLILSAQGVGEYGSLADGLFENFAHETIMEGGIFSVRSLNSGAESMVKFPKLRLNRFNKVQETKNSVYNVPNSKTFRTVDSLVLPRDLFQMTISTSHGINVGGLDNLNDILAEGMINFYFVTLADQASRFKKAKLEGPWSGRIHQMVVGIELPRTKRKFESLGVSEEESEEGGLCAVGQEGLYQAAEAAEAADSEGRR